jgi:broad specificity phosphatase PhoE
VHHGATEASLADIEFDTAMVPEPRELSYGRVTAMTPDDRRAEHPGLDERWRSAPWSVVFPDGESIDDLAARVLPTWERIVAAHVGETVLVTAHGHVNRVVLLHSRRLARDEFWSIEQKNGAADWLTCTPRTLESGAWS